VSLPRSVRKSPSVAVFCFPFSPNPAYISCAITNETVLESIRCVANRGGLSAFGHRHEQHVREATVAHWAKKTNRYGGRSSPDSDGNIQAIEMPLATLPLRIAHGD